MTTATPPGFRRYFVRPKDTLWGIAARELGNPQLWREIAADNRIREHASGRGLYLIFPGEALLLRAYTPIASRRGPVGVLPPARKRSQAAAASPAPSRSTQHQVQRTLHGAPALPNWLPRPSQEQMRAIANAVAVLPIGSKKKVIEAAISRGAAPGFRWSLSLEGEVKLQKQGEVQFWTDPAGALEYEHAMKVWGGEQAVHFLGGYELAMGSMDKGGVPDFKLTLFGVQVGTQASKVHVLSNGHFQFEWGASQQVTHEGVVAQLDLKYVLDVEVVPQSVLVPIRSIQVSAADFTRHIRLNYGEVLAGATIATVVAGVVVAAPKIMAAIATVGEILLNRACAAFSLIILTPEMLRQIEGGGRPQPPMI